MIIRAWLGGLAKNARGELRHWTRRPAIARPAKQPALKKELALMYIGYFPSGFLHEGSKFLYDWKRQVLCIFECPKIWRIHHVCQSTNMNTMKMLNYQFISNFSKSLLNFVKKLNFPNLLNMESFIIRSFFKRKVGWPSGPRACTYVGRARFFSSHWKCEAEQPDPDFASQVQVGLNRPDQPLLPPIKILASFEILDKIRLYLVGLTQYTANKFLRTINLHFSKSLFVHVFLYLYNKLKTKKNY